MTERLIALDTETTGLHVRDGHRIIEVGAVEIINRELTGEVYHAYVNPQRPIDPEAIAVHGITESFLADKPLFKAIYSEFMAFIDDATLLIHNAGFDLGFLNQEMLFAGHEEAIANPVIDTLALAREQRPQGSHSLDNLCRAYGIDNTHRDLHGALIDADLLAQLYLKMTAGQFSMEETFNDDPLPTGSNDPLISVAISDTERERHEHFIEKHNLS